MIALSDAAMAQIVIAASAVAPDRRHRWLADIARRLENGVANTDAITGRVTKSAAHIRKLRYRDRQRAGRMVLPVEVPDEIVVELVDAGFLRADDGEDRSAIALAAGTRSSGVAGRGTRSAIKG